jgi:hypothetical protein
MGLNKMFVGEKCLHSKKLQRRALFGFLLLVPPSHKRPGSELIEDYITSLLQRFECVLIDGQ